MIAIGVHARALRIWFSREQEMAPKDSARNRSPLEVMSPLHLRFAPFPRARLLQASLIAPSIDQGSSRSSQKRSGEMEASAARPDSVPLFLRGALLLSLPTRGPARASWRLSCETLNASRVR